MTEHTMTQTVPRNRWLDPVLLPVLKPAFPALAAGIGTAAASGLATLGALWCLVCMLREPTLSWAGAACFLWVSGALLASLSTWLSHDAEGRFEARLKRQVAGHLLRLPASTLSRHGGDKLRRLVSDDIGALHHMVAHLPSEIATFVIVPLASMLLLAGLAGPLALLALIPGALAAGFYLVVIPKMAARQGAEQADVMGNIMSAADDYARGIRVSRIYGAQAGAAAAYQSATRRFIDGMLERVGRVATAAAIAVALLQAVSTFAIAYAVGHELPAYRLAAALLFSLAIVTPALKLGHGLDYLSAGRAAAQRLAALLQETPLASGTCLAPEPTGQGLPLTVSDLQLQQGERHLVQGLTHIFMPGTLTAITGPSGSGKTTLLRVLAGLETPQCGEIRLGHTRVADLAEDVRSQHLLLIPQGGSVLPAAVQSTLALSAPGASEADYLAALGRAQIDIEPGADASLLSGGEKQRVGLARSFLSSASLILLDEPTSALDSQTAARLMQELLRLARQANKAILMVTHDTELANTADARLDLAAFHQGDAR